jgi:glycogen debranching enzyme
LGVADWSFYRCLAARPSEDNRTARGFLDGFRRHLESACVGSISEIFDAEPPFLPRGCCAQASSVAERLRCFAKTSGASEQLDSQTSRIRVKQPAFALPVVYT